MRTLATLTLAALLLTTGSASAGDIEGTVRLSSVRERAIGKKKIRPSKAYGADFDKDAEIPKGENELQYAVIHVIGEKLPCTPQKSVRLVQKNKTFVPHVLVVTRGSSIRFVNDDGFEHNVYSVSEPGAFDIGRYNAKLREDTFNEVNALEIFCGLHPRMNGYIVVVPNNYFARADQAGRFKIKGVPAGKYEVRVWHPRADARAFPVTVPASGATTLDAEL